MRILNAFRFILRTQRPQVPLNPSHIFQPLITESCADLLEIDFNFHKTNSSYFSDLDVSRSHLVCTLFAEGIAKMRGGTEAYTGSKQPPFGLALGGVSCNFRKEIAPYQKYELWSRILCWDQKWIYIVTHFVNREPEHSMPSSLYSPPSDVERDTSGRAGVAPVNEAPFATAISKCVFKSGRQTISPTAMLQMSGLLPSGTNGDGRPHEKLSWVEERRSQGLDILDSPTVERQSALESIFARKSGEILGRHTDGNGTIGVVCTLLQLAGLKTSQVL
jgi:hypothetical protein